MDENQGLIKGQTELLEKFWDLKDADGETFRFLPKFAVNPENGEVECMEIVIKIGEKEHTFNYLNLFTFFYFISNEELRQNLMQRYERNIFEVPYEVSFKLDKQEMESGKAKRRIVLKVDELAMAMARKEKDAILRGMLKGSALK